MASSYSSRLRAEKQATGEHASTWGSVLNTAVIDLLDDSIAGMATVAVTGGAYSLTTANGSTDEARMAILKFTGTLTSNATITIPDKTKIYVVWNATSGAYTLTLKPSSTGAAVTQGAKAIVFCDGTIAYNISSTSDGTLTIASGKTFTVNNTVTLTGTDSTTMTLPTTSATLARTDAANSFTGTQTFAGLIDASGAAAGQLKFPASQNASADANTLDDYEEGTWTPALNFGGATTGITYTTQSGKYTKTGNVVTVTCNIVLSSNGSATGSATITGLPFTAAALNHPISATMVNKATANTPGGQIPSSQSYIDLQDLATNGTSLTDAYFGDTSAFRCSATYFV